MNSGSDRLGRAGFLLAALPLLFSASCDRLSPEDRVRQTIEEAVAAARDGDAEALGEMISESYSDPMGNGKRQLMALVGFHLCREESLHLLERVRSIRQTDPGRIEAQLLLGVAGVPIDDLTKLDRFSADLLLLDIVFARESRTRWTVIEARWRRAEPVDLL
jgi:hypothetical protein